LEKNTSPKRPWLGWYSTAAWKKIRKRQLQLEPLCRMCKEMGIVTAANTVDHTTPHRGNMTLFFQGPFQSLCKTCHSSAKQRMEKSGAFGCDENGIVEAWK
jgi:5-methylcytosine-specific restriction protein A